MGTGHGDALKVENNIEYPLDLAIGPSDIRVYIRHDNTGTGPEMDTLAIVNAV